MSDLVLHFKANVNGFDPVSEGTSYIDYAVFIDPDGNEVCIEGMSVYGNYKDGVMDVEWRDCHNIADYESDLIHDEGYMEMLSFDRFELECEAPEDADVRCIGWRYDIE